ncbi:MAG: hypothetical protein PHC30_09075 [Lentisphaeria bacterium]|nr:hypothetical protein [Lentisphaeria bacterium]
MKTCLWAMVSTAAFATPFTCLLAVGAGAGDQPEPPPALAEINRFDAPDHDVIIRHDLYANRLKANKADCVSGFMDIQDAPPRSFLASSHGHRLTSFSDRDKQFLTCYEPIHPMPVPEDAASARLSFPGKQLRQLVVSAAPQPAPDREESIQNNDEPALAPDRRPFVNDICLPSTLYMLSETQNDVFVQPFIKRWRPHQDFVRFSLSRNQPFLRRLSHVASINNPVDGSTLAAELVNGDEFRTVKTLSSTIRVGVKGRDTGRVTAQIIGDSYTHGGFFRDALLKSGYVPGLSLIGLRKCGDNQYDEGRGGWRLESYFTIPVRPQASYHGWMQPEGDCRYWGVREFWATAWKCFRKTAGNAFEPNYSCGRFDDCLPRFDETTGALLNPQPGDLQFDHAQNTFLFFDGNDWTPRRQDDFNWRFDYPKYLDMWNLEAPQFLFVMLGLNDFCNHLHADYSTWTRQITTMKESYLEARPDGHFAICTPCSTCGSLDNAAGAFTLRQNAAMWNFRNHLITQFDGREQDGFHLVDTALAIDNEHGYNFLPRNNITIPYDKCPGEATLKVQTGNPHPYNSYPNLGIPIAAFIQAFRN